VRGREAEPAVGIGRGAGGQVTFLLELARGQADLGAGDRLAVGAEDLPFQFDGHLAGWLCFRLGSARRLR
jgi:hypothetical protein